MADPDTPQPADAHARFQRTMIQVLVVQAAALGVLGLIQFIYS